MRISIYDTTLRDGSQGEGINFSLQDKLLLTRRLDELGVDYIEGGYPLSNPKDFEYFQAVRTLPLKHAKIVAFGMTRRKNCDPGHRYLSARRCSMLRPRSSPSSARPGTCTSREMLGTSLEENLQDDRRFRCAIAKQRRHEVFYDAEHFFDGFKANPDYALQTLQAARKRRRRGA